MEKRGVQIRGSNKYVKETGYYLLKLSQFAKVPQFFDKAVEIDPEDKRALLGRAIANAKLLRFSEALKDLDHALTWEPDNLILLMEKATTTYLSCEFEKALIQNNRNMDRKPDLFGIAGLHCSIAIEHSVGEIGGRPLRDYFKIIRKLAWKRYYGTKNRIETSKPKKEKKKRYKKEVVEDEPVMAKESHKNHKGDDALELRDSLNSVQLSLDMIPPYYQPCPFRPLARRTTNLDNYMSEKYLRAMNHDKKFLNEMLDHPGLKCLNEEGNAQVTKIAKKTQRTLFKYQEILRTRRPYYSFKKHDIGLSGTLQEKQERERQERQKLIKKEADSILEQITRLQRDTKLKDLLQQAKKLQHLCNKHPKAMFPDKEEYLDSVFSLIPKAYYDFYRSNPRHNIFERGLRTYAVIGMPLEQTASKDSIIRQIKSEAISYKGEISKYESKLKDAVIPKEICWYYYELARLHLEQKNYKISRLYAKKCIQKAEKLNNVMWIANCSMLMCRNNIQQLNRHDAKANVERAIACAKTLHDEPKVVFFKECLNVVENVSLENPSTNLPEARTQKIIKLLRSTELKSEVSHLSRDLELIRANRRISFAPGGPRHSIAPSKRKSRKSSISSPRPSRFSTRSASGSFLGQHFSFD